MRKWDVIPDQIARAFGREYFVFPEKFVQIRDVLCAGENSAMPPVPEDIVEVVDKGIGWLRDLQWQALRS